MTTSLAKSTMKTGYTCSLKTPQVFNQKTRKLLSRLVMEAIASPKFYAAGGLEQGESNELDGLVQCTRDLSSINCKRCLDELIGELPHYCEGKEGGRIGSVSCNIRHYIESYDIWPLYFQYSNARVQQSPILYVSVVERNSQIMDQVSVIERNYTNISHDGVEYCYPIVILVHITGPSIV